MAASFVVIGNPSSRRIELFQAALAGLGLPHARLVAWADLLAGRASLAEALTPGAVVRIESPGKDFEVARALIAAGADVPDEGAHDRISRAAAERLAFDKGQILYSHQWYLGFCAALDLVERQLAEGPPHRLM